MYAEHLVYHAALALFFGVVYHYIFGRDCWWIIVLSTYAPDIDMVADRMLQSVGITFLIYGNRITHGGFHILAAVLIYAVVLAYLLHPLHVGFFDALVFSAVGYGAHIFEDALISAPSVMNNYFFWPLSSSRMDIGLGVFKYSAPGKTFDPDVMAVGLLLLVFAAVFRLIYYKRIARSLPG